MPVASAACGPHVRPTPEGTWIADWPTTEAYDIGPASIGWLTWHFGFWLEMAIDHGFGDARLDRHGVVWPGDPGLVRAWLTGLGCTWRDHVAALSDAELLEPERSRWPFPGRSRADVMAWANVELMKSAAEIGYVRFLYAVRAKSPSTA